MTVFFFFLLLQIDEDVVDLVVKMGFERVQLVDSLRARHTSKVSCS